MTRAKKVKAAQSAPEIDQLEEVPAEAASGEFSVEEPAAMELHYNVPGIARKELVAAVSGFVGTEPAYKSRSELRL